MPIMPSLLPPRSRRRRAAIAAVVALGVAGCQDLVVQNADVPQLEDIFNNPASLENTVGLSFRVFWGTAQGARDNATFPVVMLGGLADAITSANATTFEVIAEPRPVYNNNDAGQWLARKPWYDLYEVVATATDGLKALDRGLKIGVVNAATPNGADTPRARAYSRFMLGISELYLGLLYDKAFIFDETMDIKTYKYEFSPYQEVTAAAVAQLEKAVVEAKAAPTNFTLPLEWINQQTITRDELVRIMNGYITRGLVYVARNPAERTAVDWTRVLTLTDPANVITRDFGQLADQTKSGTVSTWLQYAQLMTDARADYRLLGPADTSGAFQTWLAAPLEQRQPFIIRTPDRRIHGAGGPATAGRYFSQPTSQTMSQARGPYLLSNYRSIRYTTTYYQTGFIPTMSLVEMDLIRAEAFLRLGRPADAIPLINKTRVANGQLPALTLAGGTGTLPACVPRKESGACGDLMDAMLYEKRIETQSMEALPLWADWRAFGKLPKGSLINLPVPGRELQTLGLPVYTFGGDLPGSAP
jgi:hypothetical protein